MYVSLIPSSNEVLYIHPNLFNFVISKFPNNKVNILVTTKPEEAVNNSDCVMTDKWVSMNDKVNQKQKKKNLRNYQVNKKLMK